MEIKSINYITKCEGYVYTQTINIVTSKKTLEHYNKFVNKHIQLCKDIITSNNESNKANDIVQYLKPLVEGDNYCNHTTLEVLYFALVVKFGKNQYKQFERIKISRRTIVNITIK